MDGITCKQDSSGQTLFCVVDYFSPEIQSTVREELSKVCFGEKKSTSGSPIYSYKLTLREFLKRYETKSPDTKTGMLGELLCHILLPKLCPQFRAASPYFNSEEASIKKGFDAILFAESSLGTWFTEVKAGAIGSTKTPLNKIRALIDLAKSDLSDRITENDTTTWYSAINNIEISLKDGDRAKDILMSLLSDFLNDSAPDTPHPSKSCAVLVPVLFEDINNTITFADFEAKAKAIRDSNTFSQCVIFGVQKSTIVRVEEFLREEAAK